MKALRTFFIWLVALVLLALLSWGIALYLGWPLWAAVAVFLGAIGLYFLMRFTVRMVQVMRARSRMAQVSSVSRDQLAKASSPRAALIRKWKGAVNTLRASSLKRFGNPLHVLPWYMVVGRSGTGKTTALTRTRLSSSIQKVSQSTHIEQTANYDWWYFDRAVVIDCAGRYVEAADLGQDRSEWELGLDLLAKYRGKEGLNGLVLAISTERLANPKKDDLAEEGRVIRERIDQLIRLFGKRFPVYVLVTQCDRLYGLEEWANQLSENALEQAMGYLAGPDTNEPGERKFLDEAFANIHDRLQLLRTVMVARVNPVAPELLLFPNELGQLKPGLEVFLRACFGDSAYLETPFLRGLFFSSGLQQGGAVSSLLGTVLPPVAAHPSSNAGLFLHDFFGRVLPQDRNISLPALLRNPWRTATQNLGLLAWVLLISAAAIFVSVAFFANMETLSLLEDKKRMSATFVGRLPEDSATLERLSETVSLLERRNGNWKTAWMVTSTNIDDLEATMKSSFTTNFRKYILPTTDADYREDLERIAQNDPTNDFPRLMSNLVRYINQLQARQRGANREMLLAMPQWERSNRHGPDLHSRLNQLYISNVAWSLPDDPYVSIRLREQQQLLNRLAYDDTSMTWLTGLATANPLVKPVTVHDFWSSVDHVPSDTTGAELLVVPSAFTIAGKKDIDAFLAEMEKSVDDGPKFIAQRERFELWYKEQRALAWQKFVAGFPGTERTLSGEAEWRASMALIVGPQSPYYRLMDRLNDEFAAESSAQLPSWLQLSRELGELRRQAARGGLPTEAISVVGALNTVGGKAIKQVLGGAPMQGGTTIRNNLEASAILQRFSKELGTVATDVVVGSGKAYQAAVDFHGLTTDPAVKASGLRSAADSLAQLRQLLGDKTPNDAFIWQLMGGPLRFVLAYTEEQASCSLQSEWASKVDWPLQTAPDMTAMVEQLYGAKGTVWAFADGPAKPFLTRDSNRFAIVQTLGYSVPFTRQFLPMLNDAAGKRVEQLVRQQRSELQEQTDKLDGQNEQLRSQRAMVQVDRVLADIKQKIDAIRAQVQQLTITAQPTSVNAGAKAKPFLTVLAIQCAGGARVINNYNFPVNESLALGERQCGDVTLQIKIDDVVLTKKYPGSNGVVSFLQDFRDGTRQFNVDEFPSAKAKLDALGVRQIGLRYNLEGQDAILKGAQQLAQLDKLEKDKTAEKQRIQDVQFAREERGIQARLSNATGVPGIEVSLPKQIGVCWDSRMMPHKPQDTQALFKELAAVQLKQQPAPSATIGAPASAPVR